MGLYPLLAFCARFSLWDSSTLSIIASRDISVGVSAACKAMETALRPLLLSMDSQQFSVTGPVWELSGTVQRLYNMWG